MKVTKPYRPSISLEEVLAFDPTKPETHTVSRLVNAVAEVLHDTNYIEAKDIANYLEVDRIKLSAAISLEMGMTLIELIKNYRLVKVRKFVNDHPEMMLDDIARTCGYASNGSMWRFFQRKLGQTARGEKSKAGPEHYNNMRKNSRRISRQAGHTN